MKNHFLVDFSVALSHASQTGIVEKIPEMIVEVGGLDHQAPRTSIRSNLKEDA
jgi:hypothetical protein